MRTLKAIVAAAALASALIFAAACSQSNPYGYSSEPAQPSASAQRKKRTHQTGEGIAVQSFKSLLGELARRARVIYALKSEKAGEKSNLTFSQVPEPTPLQARALELLRTFPVTAN